MKTIRLLNCWSTEAFMQYRSYENYLSTQLLKHWSIYAMSQLWKLSVYSIVEALKCLCNVAINENYPSTQLLKHWSIYAMSQLWKLSVYSIVEALKRLHNVAVMKTIHLLNCWSTEAFTQCRSYENYPSTQ